MKLPIAIETPAPCRACHGFGYRLAPARTDIVVQPDPSAFGLPERWVTVTPRKIDCNSCGGTGRTRA
jgi:hypothetical protein